MRLHRRPPVILAFGDLETGRRAVAGLVLPLPLLGGQAAAPGADVAAERALAAAAANALIVLARRARLRRRLRGEAEREA